MEAVNSREDLRRQILRLEERIAGVKDERERSILTHFRTSLVCLEEACRVADLYASLFGKKRARMDLPSPISEEELEVFVRSAGDEEVWSRVEQLKIERDRNRNRSFHYTKRYEETGDRNFRRKALFARYMYYLLRREISLFYLYILRKKCHGKEGEEKGNKS